MDFDALEKMWTRQTVKGATPSAAALTAQLKRDVTSAERRIKGGLVLAAGVFVLGWVITIGAHLTAIKRFTPVGVVADVTIACLYAAFFVRAFRSARLVRQEREALGGTLKESIAAARRTVELQIENTRLAAYAIPAVVAISVWFLAAKYFAGDIRGFGVIVGSGFMLLLGAAIGAAVWHRWRTRLVPRRVELREVWEGIDGVRE